MQRWNIIFYPIYGARHSPEDFLRDLSVSDVASIKEKLRTISELETSQWPWVKMVQGIYQLRSGDFRLYFGIDGRTIIVVCHICRKVSQQARQEDIDRAKANLNQYFETRKKP